MEAQNFTMLNEIDVPKTSTSTLKVRVLRLWSIKDNKNVNEDFLIEMVLMDEQENRIQATVYKQDIFRFKRFLKESSTLTIVNPSVGLNGSNYRVIDYPNKLVFGPNTHVNPCQEFEGRMFGFKMISFESVIKKVISLKSTIDIIGHVVHVFKTNASNVKDKNKRTMELCDLSGNCVYVTLWDHYASVLSKYVVDHFDEPYAVIVLQFGRVKYYTGSDGKGNYVYCFQRKSMCPILLDIMLAVCSLTYLFEIEEYKNSLFDLLIGNDVAIRKPIPVKMLSSVDDEFLKATYLFKICDICTIIFPKNIIIVGTIKAICLDTDWYYIGCNTCSRKDMENIGEGVTEYECKTVRCNVLGVLPTPRFKIKIRVQDSTGVVSLTLFDRDAKMLINKTAAELIDSQKQNEVENGGFPPELDCLLEKKFAIKVDVAEFNFRNSVEDYGINKLTDDTDILTELQKRQHSRLQTDSNSVSLGASMSEVQSSGSVSVKISDIGDNQTPNSNVDGEDVAYEEKGMSTSSDDKLKRKLVEVFEVDDQPSMSTTKVKPKTFEEMGRPMKHVMLQLF
ncbi:replication protein A 70 kDa DNA-binding subunit B-like [Bidens hawaiensis]|uniref:replication protein A 70 kDa DNA-binding subunit B-like n=1 Tax=Bidens hawaiensis TaxID=980011 RepID=UPI0040496EC6